MSVLFKKHTVKKKKEQRKAIKVSSALFFFPLRTAFYLIPLFFAGFRVFPMRRSKLLCKQAVAKNGKALLKALA